MLHAYKHTKFNKQFKYNWIIKPVPIIKSKKTQSNATLSPHANDWHIHIKKQLLQTPTHYLVPVKILNSVTPTCQHPFLTNHSMYKHNGGTAINVRADHFSWGTTVGGRRVRRSQDEHTHPPTGKPNPPRSHPATYRETNQRQVF